VLLHVIKHDRTRDESLSAQRAGIRPLSRVIAAVYRQGRCLRERFAAHGAEIRPLAGVDALMDHVILAMREALAAHVAHQRPGPVHGFMRTQRLGGGELFGARVAGIGDGLGRDDGTGDGAGGCWIDRRHGAGADDPAAVVAVDRHRRSMRFRMMIVQIARLEAHEAPRAGVRFLLTDLLVHPPVAFQQRAIPEARLAQVACERLLHAAGRRQIGDRCCRRGARGHRGCAVRDLVHPQVAQGDEGARADGARVPRLILDIVLVFRTRGVTRTHVIV